MSALFTDLNGEECPACGKPNTSHTNDEVQCPCGKIYQTFTDLGNLGEGGGITPSLTPFTDSVDDFTRVSVAASRRPMQDNIVNVWTCCRCNSGPFLIANCALCIDCSHMYCKSCEAETIK
jgi:hypothetical protein